MPFDHETLATHFGQIWPVHVKEFTELLITLRRQFRGDLEMMLVLAVIGSRTMPSHRAQGLTYDDFNQSRTHAVPVPPINVQSLAESTGIPRETVRRKVLALLDLGWIERRDDGMLQAAKKAVGDLAPATEASLRYLVAVGSACVTAAGNQRRN